jgi:hypothetical protein
VNESAGEQITELLHNDLDLDDHDLDPDPALDDVDADAEDDAAEAAPRRSAREGLPGSFRMRHDAHYVDELMSQAPARLDKPASIAGNAGPAAPSAPTAPAGALALIAARLESVVAHAGAVRPHQGAPALIAQSIQAELARVTRLARAAAILQDRETPIRRSLSARDIADRVMTASAPAARMAGVECEVTIDDPGFTILAEAPLVLQGIAGTVDAIVDLLLADSRRLSIADGSEPAPRVSISLLSVKVRPALILDVVCQALFVESGRAERFFDNAVDDYRSAPAAGLLLAAAAHVARAHGGRADIKRHGGVGATITYVFPQAVVDFPLT